MDLNEVKVMAELELKNERFREAVDNYKAKLRQRRSWLDRLVPFKIMIIKKGV